MAQITGEVSVVFLNYGEAVITANEAVVTFLVYK